MTALVTSLLARARGDAATVRPRLRARFEPAGLDEGAAGLTEIHEVRVIEASSLPRQRPPAELTRAPAEPQPQAASDPAKSIGAAPPRAGEIPDTRAAYTSRSFDDETVRRDPEPSQAGAAALRAPEPDYPSETSEPHRGDDLGRSADRAEAAPRGASPEPAYQASNIVVRRAVPAPSPLAAAVRASESPTIHVTIGRIELRAEGSAPASPASAAKPSPVMSLDAYLRARRGGTR
jgi:hypothetical protein